jgi:hypothetical protein
VYFDSYCSNNYQAVTSSPVAHIRHWPVVIAQSERTYKEIQLVSEYIVVALVCAHIDSVSRVLICVAATYVRMQCAKDVLQENF